MDLTTILGLALAIGAILGGQALEGGSIGTLLQLTAAIIVMGGTLGAVVVSFPGHALKATLLGIKRAFLPLKQDLGETVKTLSAMAGKARREGLVALEKEVEGLTDPFLRKGLLLAVDGMPSASIRHTLELELERQEAEAELPSKVLEAAGGYSPTIGIIGAVLGLIQVMQNLSDQSKLGAGIAVAFVATVYGVASANLIYLPMATKLKHRAHEQVRAMEIVVEGVSALADGDNPHNIETKLRGMLPAGTKEV